MGFLQPHHILFPLKLLILILLYCPMSSVCVTIRWVQNLLTCLHTQLESQCLWLSLSLSNFHCEHTHANHSTRRVSEREESVTDPHTHTNQNKTRYRRRALFLWFVLQATNHPHTHTHTHTSINLFFSSLQQNKQGATTNTFHLFLLKIVIFLSL